MTEQWKGLIWVQRNRGLYLGTAWKTEIHAGHVVKIIIAVERDAEFRFRMDGATKGWQSCQAVIVAPDQPHEVDGRGETLGFFYFMPETVEAQTLSKKFLDRGRGLNSLSRELFSSLSLRLSSLSNRGHFTCKEASGLSDELIRALELDPSISLCQTLDSRVRRAIEYLESKIQEIGYLGAEIINDEIKLNKFKDETTVERIARIAYSSISRLAHVFKDDMHIAIRHYKVMLKLRTAIQYMSITDNLDYIANAAGFHDQSHINKYFREMHGIIPSALKECYVVAEERSLLVRPGSPGRNSLFPASRLPIIFTPVPAGRGSKRLGEKDSS